MARQKPNSIIRRFTSRRIWIQSMFLLAWLDPLMLRMHSMCGPVFHCYSCPLALFACPIGVMANFSAIHTFPFLAVGVLAVMGALLGGFVCGWICPFGFFQDLVGRIPTPKYALPIWIGYLRYVVLAVLVLGIPYWYGEEHALFFCRLCPAGALEAAFPNTARLVLAGEEVVWPSVVKMSIFGVLLVAMLFTHRPWCTALCPLGAIYTLCNSFSLFFIRVNKENCNDCDRCSSLCSYGPGPRQPGNDKRCIRCLDCTACGVVEVASVFERAKRKGSDSETALTDVSEQGTGTSQIDL